VVSVASRGRSNAIKPSGSAQFAVITNPERFGISNLGELADDRHEPPENGGRRKRYNQMMKRSLLAGPSRSDAPR